MWVKYHSIANRSWEKRVTHCDNTQAHDTNYLTPGTNITHHANGSVIAYPDQISAFVVLNMYEFLNFWISYLLYTSYENISFWPHTINKGGLWHKRSCPPSPWHSWSGRWRRQRLSVWQPPRASDQAVGWLRTQQGRLSPGFSCSASCSAGSKNV